MRQSTVFAAVVIASFGMACTTFDDLDANGGEPTTPAPTTSPDPKDTLGAPLEPGAPDGSTAAPDGGSTFGPPDASNDGGAPPLPPGSCGTASPPTGFIAQSSLKVGALTRTYALDVPATYDGTKRYPIVVGFHGDGGSGAAYRNSMPIHAQGANEAIFVWPNGTNDNNGHSFDQNNDPPSNKDVPYFDALVAALGTTYCVDTARVYVHGMSGGAYFTNQLGRWRATAIRAIAPQSGGGPFGIQASDYDKTGNVTVNGPVAAFIVHGQSDTTVPISEGQKSLTYWRMADGSTSGQAATTPSPCQKQNGGSKAVVFCAIPGLTHNVWSGAPAAVWQFFSQN